MAKVPTRRSQSTEDISSIQPRDTSSSVAQTQPQASDLAPHAAVGRDRSATMRRTSSASDIPTPVTYTPTTHRISKAKKGKRVHACEFPGCNKVFTRAEHRRRHELNHSAEASFPCTYEGCRKAFHRPDLLARHMERHELDAQADGTAGRHWRQHSQTSVASDPPNMVNTMPVDTNAGSLPTARQHTGSMSIGSIVAPGVHPDLAGDYSLTWGEMEIPLQPRASVFRNHIRESADDSPFYSSPDTCASPSSDGPSFQLPTQPRSSVSSAPTSVIFHTDLTASPLQVHSSIRDWDPLMPISLEGDMLQPVDFPVPVPLSNLDGDEWFALRRELTSAPGVISGNDGMEIMDTMKWQDCFECYWQHFHPLFPIVHRPTFFATKPSPLMAGAMVAIGSQYDTRQNAKEYSLALLEACLKLLSKRIPITSRSRVTDIQTVFLLEILSKFRSRRADVQISHRFRSLYGSFMHDRHWISQNPLAVFNTLSENPSHESLKKAHKFWVEHEARRRVLQAASILDIQQSALFGQPPVLLQPTVGGANTREQSAGAIDLPFPCNSELWESRQLEDWLRLARASKPLSLSSVAATFGESSELGTGHLDTFQSTLLLAYSLTNQERGRDSEAHLRQLTHVLSLVPDGEYGQHVPRSPGLPTPRSRPLFTYHALLAARHTPLHALLTVSGESWLFNRKLPNEEDFRKAKSTLRTWASDTDDVRRGVWHAVRVLEYAVYEDPVLKQAAPNVLLRDTAQPGIGIGGLISTTNTGYEAVGSNPPRSDPISTVTLGRFLAAIQETGTSSPIQPGPLTMLHANWALYISALICWAYGFDPSTSTISASYSSDIPSQTASAIAASARSYISTMISLAPGWQQLSHARIPVAVRCNTLSLLEFIRTTRLQEGRMGGLLNEGERVLARLGETRRTVDGGIRGMWGF